MGSNQVRARVPNLIKNQGWFSADKVNIWNASCWTDILPCSFVADLNGVFVRSTAVWPTRASRARGFRCGQTETGSSCTGAPHSGCWSQVWGFSPALHHSPSLPLCQPGFHSSIWLTKAPRGSGSLIPLSASPQSQPPFPLLSYPSLLSAGGINLERGAVTAFCFRPLPSPFLFAISSNWFVHRLTSNQSIFRRAYGSFANAEAQRESSEM